MKRPAGEPILQVKQAHHFYVLPRINRQPSPTWYRQVHWLWWFVGVYKPTKLR